MGWEVRYDQVPTTLKNYDIMCAQAYRLQLNRAAPFNGVLDAESNQYNRVAVRALDDLLRARPTFLKMLAHLERQLELEDGTLLMRRAGAEEPRRPA